MNRTILALLPLTLLATAGPARAGTVDVSRAHVRHQLEAAQSVQDRLQTHVDRFCNALCDRLRVDVGIVRDALKNFENQVFHGRLDAESSRVEMDRIVHQFEAARSALGRMKTVAERQDAAWVPRVTIDVGILFDVVANLENHARHMARRQAAAAERAEAKAAAKKPARAPTLRQGVERPTIAPLGAAKLPARWSLSR